MPDYQYTPVILCGGSGTRLWPASRKAMPKQFLNLTGSECSLFQETLRRLEALENTAPAIIICNDEHRFLVAEQLRQINYSASSILLEPTARNTAPAIAAAAYWATNDECLKNTELLVFPADHHIKNPKALAAACKQSHASTKRGQLCVFGITPQHPETGYGYIEAGEIDKTTGNYEVSSFKEKPDQETAEAYCTSSKHFWNGGIFGFTPQAFMDAATLHAPLVTMAVEKAVAHAALDLDFVRLDNTAFSESPDISVDYAILEHAHNIHMVPLDAQWSDLGAWNSIASLTQPDKQNNRVTGSAILSDSHNCYVNSQDRTVALLGVENMVVIEREDAVLVTTLEHSQHVKKIVQHLKTKANPVAESHVEIHRPWGSYRSIDNGKGYQVKHITVLPGRKLSLQKHFKRAEHWIVVSGTALVTCDDKQMTLGKNESTYIPLGAVHRLENVGESPLELIEVQSGDYLGEDDIVRLDDIYGRTQ